MIVVLHVPTYDYINFNKRFNEVYIMIQMMCFIFHKRVMGSGQSNTCGTCEVMLAEAENNTHIKQNEITKMGAQIKELNTKLKSTQDELNKIKSNKQSDEGNTKILNKWLEMTNKRMNDVVKDLDYNLFGFANM